MMTKSYYLYELVIKTFFFKLTEIVKYIKIDIFKFSGFINFFSSVIMKPLRQLTEQTG